MKCFTFFHCQLKEGLLMTQYVPPNDMALKGYPKEVLFLGEYGKKYTNGPSNIARNVNLDLDNPALIEEVPENHRIITNPFNRMEPSFSAKISRVVGVEHGVFPRRIPRYRKDGEESFLTVLAKSLQKTSNILVRVNTSSAENITGRRGKWYPIYGRPTAVSRARSVREHNGFTKVAWTDDLIIFHNQDTIRVVTEGSEEIDDQVMFNMSGHLVMTPAATFYMSGIQPEPMTAETIEKEMVLALAANEVIPE